MQGLNISNLVSGAQHRAAVGMDPIKNMSILCLVWNREVNFNFFLTLGPGR